MTQWFNVMLIRMHAIGLHSTPNPTILPISYLFFFFLLSHFTSLYVITTLRSSPRTTIPYPILFWISGLFPYEFYKDRCLPTIVYYFLCFSPLREIRWTTVVHTEHSEILIRKLVTGALLLQFCILWAWSALDCPNPSDCGSPGWRVTTGAHLGWPIEGLPHHSPLWSHSR